MVQSVMKKYDMATFLFKLICDFLLSIVVIVKECTPFDYLHVYQYF